MSNYIPLEIQLVIMKRLPIKSLIRFRSVCKPWKSLIGSSEFVTDYNKLLQHTQSQQKHHLLVKYDDRYDNNNNYNNNNVEYVSIVVDDDTFPRSKFSLTFPMSVKPTIIIAGSQGLVCIYEDCEFMKSVVIWNPTIRKSVTINVPNVLYDAECITYFGFGVCPRTNDPKLVKIICPISASKDIPCQQVEVFTLSSGLWRTPLSSNLPDKSIEFRDDQIVIDRFIYWRGGSTYVNDMIMSFDMITEEFAEIHLPDSLQHEDEDNMLWLISKLKESLVMLEKIFNFNQLLFCNVWIMEHGVPKSFTKLYTIDTPNGLLADVIGFSKSGEPIITMKKGSKHEEVCVYEPCSQHITYIGISGSQFSFSVSSYMETLLLVDR